MPFYFAQRYTAPKGILLFKLLNIYYIYIFLILLLKKNIIKCNDKKDIGFDNALERYCPDLMEEIQADDHFTDSDSDGEGPPEIQVLLIPVIQIKNLLYCVLY